MYTRVRRNFSPKHSSYSEHLSTALRQRNKVSSKTFRQQRTLQRQRRQLFARRPSHLGQTPPVVTHRRLRPSKAASHLSPRSITPFLTTNLAIMAQSCNLLHVTPQQGSPLLTHSAYMRGSCATNISTLDADAHLNTPSL